MNEIPTVWQSGPLLEPLSVIRHLPIRETLAVQLSPGDFLIEGHVLHCETATLFCSILHTSVCNHNALWDDYVTISLPVEISDEYWVNGHLMEPPSAYFQCGSTYQVAFGGPRKVFAIALPRSKLLSAFAALAGVDQDDIRLQDMAIPLSEMSYARLKRYFVEAFRSEVGAASPAPASDIDHLARSIVSAFGLALLEARPELEDRSVKILSPMELVRRAMEAQRATGKEFASLDQLCAASGASASTLTSAFREICGMPPCRFFRMQRFNQARGQLLRAHQTDSSVKQVALGLGFSELGRFSVEYKKLFGEPPSETLKHRKVFGMGGRIVLKGVSSR